MRLIATKSRTKLKPLRVDFDVKGSLAFCGGTLVDVCRAKKRLKKYRHQEGCPYIERSVAHGANFGTLCGIA
jgi:hypothetical protein